MVRPQSGSKLLLDEYPLIVLPSLAVALGLNEAIVLQQVHYLLQISKHVIEGRKWVYNSYPNWCLIFPFLSERTIKRTIYALEEQGILLSDCFNKLKLDKTKWYSIDYDQLDKIIAAKESLIHSKTSSTAAEEELLRKLGLS